MSTRRLFHKPFTFTASLLLLSAPLFAEVENFSFLHMSDVHISPYLSEPGSLDGARSYECVRGAAGLEEMTLEPFGVKAPALDFVIVTGDITEYGWPDFTEEVVDRYFEGIAEKVYHGVGNHDNTWVTPSNIFRERFGGMNYVFDHKGVRFISLQTATFQEPLPSVGREALKFLTKTLAGTPDETPIILFCHHPWTGLSSDYERDLLLRTIRNHNVVAVLVGHHHSTAVDDYDGLPGIHGGSPFMKGRKEGQPDQSGYTVFSFADGKLYGAHKYIADTNPSKEIVKLEITGNGSYPEISLLAQVDLSKTGLVTLRAELGKTEGTVKEARIKVDGEIVHTAEAVRVVTYKTDDIDSGAHAVRVEFEMVDGKVYHRSGGLHIAQSKKENQGIAVWRTFLDGSSQAAPVVADGALYVGSNDGAFQALNIATGERVWKTEIDAEIVGETALYKNTVLFGAGDGYVYALSRENGKVLWKKDTGKPIYSTPVIEKDMIYIGNNAAELIALDATTGEIRWRNDSADYSIEVPPTLANGKVYYGAWGGKVYAVNTSDGSLAWSQPGPRCESRIVRYYAPADAPVVAANGKLYVTDRGYWLGAYETDGTYSGKLAEDVAAFSPASDGKGLILRRGTSGVTKMGWNGSVIWESKAVAGRNPIPPTVTEDGVYVCSDMGTLHALNPDDGKTMWTYQVTPQLRVFSQVTVADGMVYTTGMDGAVTAIKPPTKKKAAAGR